MLHDHAVRHFVLHSFSSSREEENCRREAAANKISSLKNPGAFLRGHLINNNIEKSARCCSLRHEERRAHMKDEERYE